MRCVPGPASQSEHFGPKAKSWVHAGRDYMKKNKAKRVVGVRLDQDVYKYLVTIAEIQGIDISSTIRHILDLYIDRKVK